MYADLHPKAKLVLNAPFIMGYKRIEGSKLESRLLMRRMEGWKSSTVAIRFIIEQVFQVFKGAHLEIGGDASVNVGLNLYLCQPYLYRKMDRWRTKCDYTR